MAPFGMSLPAPLFLAARYLKPKRTFLAVITLISVIGVTLVLGAAYVIINAMVDVLQAVADPRLREMR